MYDKHQVTEEPCVVKVTRTDLESSGSREGVADFNAKTSTERGWDGKQINSFRDKYARVRASLQTRRRARRILQRLSGRERRFQTWLNHNISKSIITEAKENNCAVAIENLTGIRKRINE